MELSADRPVYLDFGSRHDPEPRDGAAGAGQGGPSHPCVRRAHACCPQVPADRAAGPVLARVAGGVAAGGVGRADPALRDLPADVGLHPDHDHDRVRRLRGRRAGRAAHARAAVGLDRPAAGAAGRPRRPDPVDGGVRHRGRGRRADGRPDHPGPGHRGGARRDRGGHARRRPGARRARQRPVPRARHRQRRAHLGAVRPVPARADAPDLLRADRGLRRPGDRGRAAAGDRHADRRHAVRCSCPRSGCPARCADRCWPRRRCCSPPGRWPASTPRSAPRIVARADRERARGAGRPRR